MALSAHLFVISAAIAAAASAQELSGEICLYAGIRKATEMVFSFRTQLNTIPRKTQQGYLRMLINEEVTSGLYLPWLRSTELFRPVSASSYICLFVRITAFIILIKVCRRREHFLLLSFGRSICIFVFLSEHRRNGRQIMFETN